MPLCGLSWIVDLLYLQQSDGILSALSQTRHKAAIHKGITYKCDLCEYTAKQKGSVDAHKRGHHGGENFTCDQCDYK